MRKEREARLLELIQAGKDTKDFTFIVKHKQTGVETEIPGTVVSGFLDESIYELTEKKAAAKAPKGKA